jgi:hypothetical protein
VYAKFSLFVWPLISSIASLKHVIAASLSWN